MRVVSVLFMISVFFTALFAQVKKDPEATKLLDEASAKFKALKSFEADFTYSLESTAMDTKESFSGNIIVAGDKYKITKDNGEEIYCDGKSVVSFYKQDNEATIFPYEPSDDNTMSPTKVVDMYKEGYKYVMAADESYNGTTYKVVDLEPDLTPEEKKYEQVYKIRLLIHPTTKQIVKWKIFEKNGNRYTTEIKNFKPNVSVSESTFKFEKSKYPGVYVEDMR